MEILIRSAFGFWLAALLFTPALVAIQAHPPPRAVRIGICITAAVCCIAGGVVSTLI